MGSDFPVESMNPLSGFYAAVTRVSSDGKSPHGPGGWYMHIMLHDVISTDYFHRFPEQCISRQEALRGNNRCSYQPHGGSDLIDACIQG